MNIHSDLKRILGISSEGRLTAQLHLSVLIPEVFKALTGADREIYFAGSKFKKWTKEEVCTASIPIDAKNR